MTDATVDFQGFMPGERLPGQKPSKRGQEQDKKPGTPQGKVRDAQSHQANSDKTIHPGMFIIQRSGLVASSRFMGIAAISGAVTFVLFVIMQGLVNFSDGARLDETVQFRLIDVIEDIQETEPRPIERVIEKPVEVELPPEAPMPVASLADADSNAIDLSISIPRTTQTRLAGPSLDFTATSDGDYLPLVVIQPQYPRRALERGLEGYVIIELTVAADGTVQGDSIRVLEAEPKGIFDRSSIQAARKFKYRPKVVDGKGVPVPGVTYRFSFNMDDNK